MDDMLQICKWLLGIRKRIERQQKPHRPAVNQNTACIVQQFCRSWPNTTLYSRRAASRHVRGCSGRPTKENERNAAYLTAAWRRVYQVPAAPESARVSLRKREHGAHVALVSGLDGV